MMKRRNILAVLVCSFALICLISLSAYASEKGRCLKCPSAAKSGAKALSDTSPGNPWDVTTDVKVIEQRVTCCGNTRIKRIVVPAKSNPWDAVNFWRVKSSDATKYRQSGCRTSGGTGIEQEGCLGGECNCTLCKCPRCDCGCTPPPPKPRVCKCDSSCLPCDVVWSCNLDGGQCNDAGGHCLHGDCQKLCLPRTCGCPWQQTCSCKFDKCYCVQ